MSASAQRVRSEAGIGTLHPSIALRWSPRSYEPTAVVPEAAVVSILEAARWSPSSTNSQPWRFMVAARRSNPFELILAHLNERNKLWAHNASMLIVNAVEEYDEAGRSLPWAKYDLGQAVAYMSMQATYEGLHLRQMGGVNAAGLHSILELDNRLSVVTISALGVAADPQLLATDRLVRQETAVRRRLPMREILLQSPESCPSIIALDASRLSSGRT